MPRLTFRAATVAVADLVLPAFTDADVEKARQAAHFFKEKYWECLGAEVERAVRTNMSAQDFSLFVKGACQQERERFRVPLVDYIAMKHRAATSDTPAVLSAADSAISMSQEGAVTGFINLRTKR
jgi:hypothetical protein